ncbi:Clavaminate synthase-like protein [Mycena indigotica]|uniref:Clavaminate synthase-like protein n=1 Tax=Mycena indigotica TaxID=2126181 RepID=A0A8H6SRW8_9AGAR|nr:Clavaminate synthase-like protein [Mycena indigotica]KAF7304103.1 Clavaminate synthase-like protein [Mycena indigotica]
MPSTTNNSVAARRLAQVTTTLAGLSTAAAPPQYVAPPATKENLPYADLAVIDLSQGHTLSGRRSLATEVVRAMRTHGFFYVVNHGYSAEQTTRMFSIANETFDAVSEGEKAIYTGQSASVYEGYKPRQTWKIEDGVQDQIEHYNINRQVYNRPHPEPLRPYLAEIEAFARHNHFNILHPILRLLAMGMGLPDEALVEQHSFDEAGESSVRFMKYYPRSVDEEQRTKQVWLKGHTDIGSVTILWSQPVGGLQILSPDGQWRWVRHMENALVINAGDVLTFLCGGFYPATRHRVIQPPADQRGRARVGVFYFAMANDALPLVPHTHSPVLQHVGVQRQCADADAPTMQAWRQGVTAAYGRSTLVRSKQDARVEEEVIAGVVVKHYN